MLSVVLCDLIWVTRSFLHRPKPPLVAITIFQELIVFNTKFRWYQPEGLVCSNSMQLKLQITNCMLLYSSYSIFRVIGSSGQKVFVYPI